MAIQSVQSQPAYINNTDPNPVQKKASETELKKFESDCDSLYEKRIRESKPEFDKVVSILKEKLQSEKHISLEAATDVMNKLASNGSVKIDKETYTVSLKPHIESHACEDTSRAAEISTVDLLNAHAEAELAALKAKREGHEEVLDFMADLAKHSAKEALDQEVVDTAKKIAALLNQPKNTI